MIITFFLFSFDFQFDEVANVPEQFLFEKITNSMIPDMNYKGRYCSTIESRELINQILKASSYRAKPRKDKFRISQLKYEQTMNTEAYLVRGVLHVV